jgi:hypothetical protein
MASFGLMAWTIEIGVLARNERPMKRILAVAAMLLLVAPGGGAAKSGKRVKAQQQQQQQIACTVLGCVPVPRGCGQTEGRTWSGMPTGGDVIVCPPGVAPFR